MGRIFSANFRLLSRSKLFISRSNRLYLIVFKPGTFAAGALILPFLFARIHESGPCYERFFDVA